MGARKDYKKIRKKYKMPKLKDLENTFAFKLSKDSEDFLYDICKGVFESIEYAEETLEPLLFVSESSGPPRIYESGLIKRKKCFKIYKKIKKLKWDYKEAYFTPKEEKLREFIKNSYKVWKKQIQEYLIKLSEKMKRGWEKYKAKKKDSKQTYLG